MHANLRFIGKACCATQERVDTRRRTDALPPLLLFNCVRDFSTWGLSDAFPMEFPVRCLPTLHAMANLVVKSSDYATVPAQYHESFGDGV